MKLFKGLHTDTLKVNQPQDTWRGARNLVFKRDSLRTEEGFSQVESFESPFLPIGELVLPDGDLLTFLVDEGNANRIVKGDLSSVSSIVTTFNFGFSRIYPIRAKAKYTNDLDIEVVFTDDYNPPRHITIDAITGQIQEGTIEETKLFPDISIPNFSLKSVDSGGFLDKGSWYMTIAYNFGDDAYTNWVGMSNQIIVETGGQGFTIEISDLDTSFDSFKIGLIRANEDVVITAQQSNIDYTIDISTKTITIIGGGADISAEGIITKSISYNRIGDFAALDNRLYAAKLYRDAVLDYQQYANAIKIEPVYEDLVALDSEEGSYADPLIVFDKVGFQDDEVYALFIRLHLKDGTVGGDFFIQSNEENGMLYHENTNEAYPTGKGYPSGNVKHHLFPKKVAADFLSGSNSGGTAADATRGSGTDSQQEITADVLYVTKYAADGVGTMGTLGNDPIYAAATNNTVTFADSLQITISYDYNLACTTTASTDRITLSFQIFKKTGAVYTLIEDYSEAIASIGTLTIADTGVNDVTVASGDSLIVRGVVSISNGTGTLIDTMEVNWNMVVKGIIPSVNANFFTKPTGIKVTNIVIPSAIEDKIYGYEIMYASRNGTNSRVLGQSILYPEDWLTTQTIVNESKTRFHAFDILLNKPRIYPTDFRAQWSLSETDVPGATKYVYLGNSVGSSTLTTGVVKPSYIPNNNVAANNEDGEEHYSFFVDTELTGRLVGNLITNKTDYYLGFEAQILQSTGIIHKVTGSGTYSINKIYGGDSYTCLYDLRLTKKRPTGDTSDYYLRNTEFPVQSRFNISLREWGDNWWEQPKVTLPPYSDLESLGLDTKTVHEKMDYTKQYSNYFEYDKGFNFGNKFIQGKIQGDQIEDSPFRIVRTPEQNLESKTSSWRTFLPNDYYEQNRDRGIINNIDVIDTDKLIIHHRNGLFITNAKERLATSTTEIVIGTGDVFGMPPKEIIYTKEGYLGSKYKFANFVCQLGYVFISNGRIYALSSQLQDLTSGEEEFFYHNLDTGDNPYLQDRSITADYVGGISMAYDDKYKRLLVSVNTHPTNASYTKSFSKYVKTEQSSGWISNHDYYDCKLFNTNKELYSFHDSVLFKHNIEDTRAIYYDSGLIYDSLITIIANRESAYDKAFQNINWKLTGLENERNFKFIEVNSDLDTTNHIALVPYAGSEEDFTVNVRRKHSTWYFNKLTVNEAVLGEDNPITGLYAEVKLTLGNDSQDEIAIIDIDYDYQIIDVQ